MLSERKQRRFRRVKVVGMTVAMGGGGTSGQKEKKSYQEHGGVGGN